MKSSGSNISHYLTGSEFLRNLGRYSLSATSGQVMMMIYFLIVARVLGPEQFGIYSGTYALTGLTIFAVNWGMDTWLLRDSGSLLATRESAGRVLCIKAGLGLGWALLLVVCAPIIRPDVFTPWLVLVSALDIWCDGALATHYSALTIQKRIKEISRIIFLSRAVRLFGALAIFLIGFSGSPMLFTIIRLAGAASGLLVAVLVVKPNLTAHKLVSHSAILKQAVPYGLSDFLTLVYFQADIFLLTLLKGSEVTGLYAPASGLINALFVIPAAVYNLTIPMLVHKMAVDKTTFNRLVVKVMLGFLVLGLGLGVGVGLFGGWILRLLLGPSYAIASVLLAILSPILFLKSLSYGFAAVILAIGWQRQRLLPQGISATYNILANLWIIPILGAVGVSMVYVASEFVLVVGYGGLVIKWAWSSKKQPI